MKTCLFSTRCHRLLSATLFSLALCHPLRSEEVGFRHIVQLALQHSGTAAIASAEQVRAQKSLEEARNLFLPQVTLGSGLAYTYGFPLSIEGSAPAIVNVNSQQFLFNLAQRDFIHAAERDLNASNFSAEDKKNEVVLEAALDYAELDAATSMLTVLHDQETAAVKAEQVTSQRVGEGVDNGVELTRARLSTAKTRASIAEMEGTAELLRTRLSQLTGLPAASIVTSAESIPKFPPVSQQDDFAGHALALNPAVKQADESAAAKELRARGEHRNYPMIDLVAQYGLFSKANNYDQYFVKFQRNNALIGVDIRFPFLNFSQRSHAAAADAEAVIAKKQAEGVKNQVGNETLRLQRAVRQLTAQKEVARLQYELARADVETAQAHVQSGQASVKDEQAVLVSEQETYFAFLQAGFALDKAQMELLRQTNQLQGWALGSK